MVKNDNANCTGVAFQFPDEEKNNVLSYLKRREGKGFSFPEIEIWFHDGSNAHAYTPIYEGDNKTFFNKKPKELVSYIEAAKGEDGLCASYVRNIADQLAKMGITDAVVDDLIQNMAKKTQDL